jgi:hypothetical protein
MLAGGALATLPILLEAQTPSTQHAKPKPADQHQPAQRPMDHDSPQHHLQEAKRVLNGINEKTLKGEPATQIADIRRHFNQLESAWRGQAPSSQHGAAEPSGHSTGHATGTTGTTASAGAGGWMTHYSAIDQILDRVLGDNPSASAGAATGTSGSASATTSRAGVSAGARVAADAKVTGSTGSTRMKLLEFRKHLDAFHSTAMKSPHGAAHLDVPAPDDATASPAVVAEAPPASPTTTTRPPGPMVSPHPPKTSASGSNTSPRPTGTTGVFNESTDVRSTARPVDSAAINRLTAAIDDMLRANASANSNSVCVDRATLEQLRSEIQALAAAGGR